MEHERLEYKPTIENFIRSKKKASKLATIAIIKP